MAPLSILLVDDEPADVRLVQELFKSSRMCNPLHVVEDGTEAVEYLLCKGRHSAASRPGLVLLDLNLPRMDGQEVLAWMRNEPAVRDIPVIILTNSEDGIELVNTYGKEVTRYITKPLTASGLLSGIWRFEELAFAIVRCPPPQEIP